MHNILFVTLMLQLLSGSAVVDNYQIRSVTTYGTASVEVAPDRLTWSLRVSAEGEDLEKISSGQSARVREVLEFLASRGIAGEDIRTGAMRFAENNAEPDAYDQEMRGVYRASTGIGFILRDPQRYGEFWLGLAKMPGVSVTEVNYDYSGRVALENEVREKALLAAQEKAESMAMALRCTLRSPILLEEENGAGDFSPADAGEGEPDEVLSFGQLTVKTTVKAVFHLTCP